MVRTLLQVTSLSFTVMAAYFLIKGVLRMTPKVMSELSQTRWGYSSHVTKNLAMQKADTIVGFVLLLFSFFIALANLLWPMRSIDFWVNWYGLILAVLLSVVFFIFARKTSDVLQQRYYEQAANILTAEMEKLTEKKSGKKPKVPQR